MVIFYRYQFRRRVRAESGHTDQSERREWQSPVHGDVRQPLSVNPPKPDAVTWQSCEVQLPGHRAGKSYLPNHHTRKRLYETNKPGTITVSPQVNPTHSRPGTSNNLQLQQT